MAWDMWLDENWTPENGPYEFADLKPILLDAGGERAIKGVAFGSELARIVENGWTMEPSSDEPILIELDPSQCHFNAARLWMSEYDDHGGYAGNAHGWNIMTGYGLGPGDAVWLEHTWLTDEMATIVETTVPRDAYFGVELENHGEAKAFCAGEGVHSVLGE